MKLATCSTNQPKNAIHAIVAASPRPMTKTGHVEASRVLCGACLSLGIIWSAWNSSLALIPLVRYRLPGDKSSVSPARRGTRRLAQQAVWHCGGVPSRQLAKEPKTARPRRSNWPSWPTSAALNAVAASTAFLLKQAPKRVWVIVPRMPTLQSGGYDLFPPFIA